MQCIGGIRYMVTVFVSNNNDEIIVFNPMWISRKISFVFHKLNGKKCNTLQNLNKSIENIYVGIFCVKLCSQQMDVKSKSWCRHPQNYHFNNGFQVIATYSIILSIYYHYHMTILRLFNTVVHPLEMFFNRSPCDSHGNTVLFEFHMALAYCYPIGRR